jgi:hypothetical protein
MELILGNQTFSANLSRLNSQIDVSHNLNDFQFPPLAFIKEAISVKMVRASKKNVTIFDNSCHPPLSAFIVSMKAPRRSPKTG